jgi:hypothetical protein
MYPGTKQISEASWRLNSKRDMRYIPNKANKVAVKEQMLDSFDRTTKATLDTSPPCLLAKLSFVRVTPFFKYHMNILILSGTFNLQRGLFLETTPCVIKVL